jgi:Glycosyltransferase 61
MTLLSFQNVLVTPYTDLLQAGLDHLPHRGGPHWPDFDRQHEARHCRRGKPADHEPRQEPARDRIAGTWAWAGPICTHFGHQILEFSMRLAPTLASEPGARFLFAPGLTGYPASVDESPQFVKDVLNWFSIPLTRCHVVASPVMADELLVAPQSEQLGGPGPSPQHLDLMDAHTDRRLGDVRPRGTVYVSRAGMSARFAGEAFLEEAMTRCGVRVVRPETMPLVDQLRVYRSAESLIFAEGSALYGPLLMGRSLGDVVVLKRFRFHWRALGKPMLEPRAQSLRYYETISDLIPGRAPSGRMADFAGVAVLDEEALLETFDLLDIPLRSHWDPRRYADLRDADIEAHRRMARHT